MTRPLVVAITGASGVIYGVRMLEVLQRIPDIETHLIISAGGQATLSQETGHRASEIRRMADVVHSDGNLGAAISSGSFGTLGMVVVPCSIKTLSGIANSYDDNLVVRAADVTLKERRTLVLAVRETPLHLGHLKLMTDAAQIGAVIFPPVPAFYHGPHTIQDLIDQSVGRMLDQFGIEMRLFGRWDGNASAASPANPEVNESAD